jgi:hypothetical protein
MDDVRCEKITNEGPERIMKHLSARRTIYAKAIQDVSTSTLLHANKLHAANLKIIFKA